MTQINNDDIIRIKKETASRITAILNKLEKSHPGITEGMATIIGGAVGGGGSLLALIGLGTSGLSAAGISSGLAAAGSIIGGGMVAGIGVLAAPVAILAVAGYSIAKKRSNAKLAAALGQAIGDLYDIQEHLVKNAEYFVEEIAGIKATIEYLKMKLKAK
jgi:hypothetical protein